MERGGKGRTLHCLKVNGGILFNRRRRFGWSENKHPKTTSGTIPRNDGKFFIHLPQYIWYNSVAIAATCHNLQSIHSLVTKNKRMWNGDENTLRENYFPTDTGTRESKFGNEECLEMSRGKGQDEGKQSSYLSSMDRRNVNNSLQRKCKCYLTPWFTLHFSIVKKRLRSLFRSYQGRCLSVYTGDEYFSATSWIFHSYLNAEMTLNSPLTIIKNFSSHISIKLQHNSANRAWNSVQLLLSSYSPPSVQFVSPLSFFSE